MSAKLKTPLYISFQTGDGVSADWLILFVFFLSLVWVSLVSIGQENLSCITETKQVRSIHPTHCGFLNLSAFVFPGFGFMEV